MIATALCLAVLAAPQTLQDEPLLLELQRRAVLFFVEQSNSSTGFTKDRAANLTSSDSYTVASIASTGFSLAAYAVGANKGWLSQPSALSKAQAAVFNVKVRWAQNHGWFYHFVDWRNGQRAFSSEVSSIDTAIFFMGAIVAEQYFNDPSLTANVESMISSVDWQWMLTNGGVLPDSKTFCMGWVPETGFLSARWDDYNELMGLYILALGNSSAVPASCWTSWTRRPVSFRGYTCLTGGPLFMHQMSHVFMNFKGRKDGLGYDYGAEAVQATLANRQYCIDNPKHYTSFGAGFWGLSAGDTPDGYIALGAPGTIIDNGTIIPTSGICAGQDVPTQAKQLANNLYASNAAAFGRYGFSNGINPSRNWIDPDVIGIDLGMMMLGISNHQDEFVHNLTMSQASVKRGFARARLRPIGMSVGPTP